MIYTFKFLAFYFEMVLHKSRKKESEILMASG